MRSEDLINPQTDEQEAANAAYIARECRRIQATWSKREECKQRGGDPERVPVRLFTNATGCESTFVELTV